MGIRPLNAVSYWWDVTPTRPTNSGKTVYAISRDALNVIKSYGTSSFSKNAQKFLENHGNLSEKYEKKRNLHKIPIKLKGKKLLMSPGKHNKLQKDIIDKFASRFAGNSTILYFGDTAKKHLLIEKEILNKINIPVTKHDKLPDIVLYDERKNRLFLIEAVTSHGPVSAKRHYEVEKMLKDCPAEKIYISAFPDFTTYIKYAKEIAWETEAWISENPDHMIHYDGEKFIQLHK